MLRHRRARGAGPSRRRALDRLAGPRFLAIFADLQFSLAICGANHELRFACLFRRPLEAPETPGNFLCLAARSSSLYTMAAHPLTAMARRRVFRAPPTR